jgi:hypothetical protein
MSVVRHDEEMMLLIGIWSMEYGAESADAIEIITGLEWAS